VSPLHSAESIHSISRTSAPPSRQSLEPHQFQEQSLHDQADNDHGLYDLGSSLEQVVNPLRTQKSVIDENADK